MNITNTDDIEKNNMTIEQATPNEKYSNISWSPAIEKNILEIGEKSKGYKIMHIKTSRQIGYKYDWLMYSGIFLGPLAGLFSGIGAMLHPESETTFPILSACVAFISGIVVAVTKYGKFEEKSSHHRLAASKYTSLESNVRRQLALTKTDRINAGQYLEWLGNSFDDLFLASPLISSKIYEKYIKIAKEKGLSVPDEYGMTININETYQNKKIHELKNDTLIDINMSEQGSKQIENSNDSSGETDTFKGNKQIKRTKSMSHYPELNKFSDGRMEYEMQRMMGIK